MKKCLFLFVLSLMGCSSVEESEHKTLEAYLANYLVEEQVEQVWLVPKTACSGCLSGCFERLQKEASRWQANTVIITSDSLKLPAAVRQDWRWRFDQSGALDRLPGPLVDLNVLRWQDGRVEDLQRIKREEELIARWEGAKSEG